MRGAMAPPPLDAMKYVLTLIGKALSADHLSEAAALVGAEAPACWLAEGAAAELFFEAPSAEATARVRRALGGAEIDLAVQAARGRRRRLLLADMDSTIITVECIDEMADMLGLKEEIQAITAAAMAGELDFAQALRRRVAMLEGLPLEALQRVMDERVTLTAGARTLVQTMRADGAFTVLISGGFSFFTEQVAEAAGFDRQFANRLSLADGRLDGTVLAPIVDRNVKLETLRRLAAERGLDRSQTMAVGDGANDLEMVRAAGLGVAFHAKPVLADAAAARIDHNDLTALLYLQGYRKDEFRG
jgi:phosphoserine phosphatase